MQKYIKTADGDFMVFSKSINHGVVAAAVIPGVASAGFIHRMDDGSLHCVGESITLGLASLPEDTKQLREWLS